MQKLFINMAVSKWPSHSFHLQTTATAGEPAIEVLRRATGLYDALKDGALDKDFLIEHVDTYLAEAFASGETHTFARTYGDDSPLGTGWRVHIDGITDVEIERRQSCDMLGEMKEAPSRDETMVMIFKDGTRRDALVRMTRLDEDAGLLG